ncbi:MAG: hypothetical protein R2695_21970 [Acidimicrobiales bacterium]
MAVDSVPGCIAVCWSSDRATSSGGSHPSTGGRRRRGVGRHHHLPGGGDRTALAAVQLGRGTLGRLTRLLSDGRARAMFVLTAGLLGVNWLVFVWAVGDGRVLEASLGYFINLLMSVALGVVAGERLRRARWSRWRSPRSGW